MKTIEIKGTSRTELGKKGSNQVRKEGNVPCVMYAAGGNIHFSAPEMSFKNLVYTPDAHLVQLVIEDKAYRAVLKDIQFHPVKDNILHIDFMEVHADKPVIINIPVKLFGDSIGVIAGGKLVTKRRNLKVKGLADDLPEHLSIDISKLKIHDSVKVGDLAYDKIELLDPKKLMVVTIATSRVAQKTGGEAGEGAAAE
jgi:large subunit ribosomal protein L25